MLLFISGRGTLLGTVVPKLEIATNSDIMERKPRWLHFSAGELLEGFDRAQDLQARLFDLLLYGLPPRVGAQ